jgi:hypothetical protein
MKNPDWCHPRPMPAPIAAPTAAIPATAIHARGPICASVCGACEVIESWGGQRGWDGNIGSGIGWRSGS